MFGKVRSLKTREEWESFKKTLHDKDRYIIELEAYKLLPFGNEILKYLDYMLSVDATTVYDENNKIIDFQAVVDPTKYKNYKTRRFTILKEYFEKEDAIEQANFKCFILETIWESLCSLLQFEPISKRTMRERKMYESFDHSLKAAISVKQKIDAIKIYSEFISQRFFQAYPYLKQNSVFVNQIVGLLMNVIIMLKTKSEFKFESLRQFTSTIFAENSKKSLKDRLGDNFEKYRRIILYTRCISEKLPALSGVQKKACDLEQIIPSTFAKWKSINNEDYWQVYNSFTNEELESALKKVKKTYID